MPNKSLVVATTRLLEIHARLLAAYASDDEIDPRWVCRVLLSLGDEFAGRYPPAVTRMAAIARVQFQEGLGALHHGLGSRDCTRPGEWRVPQRPQAKRDDQDESTTFEGRHAGGLAPSDTALPDARR